MLVSPVVGGRLTQRSVTLPFVVSLVVGFTNALFLACMFRETAPLARQAYPSHGVGGCNSNIGEGGHDHNSLWAVMSSVPSPLGFLRLFRHGRTLSLLTVSAGLHSVCEFGPHAVSEALSS
jgi:hypothetical protein